MPDITVCANPENCPKRYECWRAIAPHTPLRQSCAEFYQEGEECAHYWPMKDKTTVVGATLSGIRKP